jgi:hypothetical protein
MAHSGLIGHRQLQATNYRRLIGLTKSSQFAKEEHRRNGLLTSYLSAIRLINGIRNPFGTAVELSKRMQFVLGTTSLVGAPIPLGKNLLGSALNAPSMSDGHGSIALGMEVVSNRVPRTSQPLSSWASTKQVRTVLLSKPCPPLSEIYSCSITTEAEAMHAHSMAVLSAEERATCWRR